MPGKKGEITRAKTKGRKAVYLSDVLGVWAEGKHLHITMQKGEQSLHTSITAADGQLCEVLRMLYHHGLALNP